MSLIADSLKKASQEKKAEWSLPPDYNVVSRKPGNARVGTLLKFLLLVLIPAGILIYLFQEGAFQSLLSTRSGTPAVSPVPAESAATPAPRNAPVSRYRSPAEIAAANERTTRSASVETAAPEPSAAVAPKPAIQKKTPIPPPEKPRSQAKPAARQTISQAAPARKPAKAVNPKPAAAAPVELVTAEASHPIPQHPQTVKRQAAATLQSQAAMQPVPKIAGAVGARPLSPQAVAIAAKPADPVAEGNSRPVPKEHASEAGFVSPQAVAPKAVLPAGETKNVRIQTPQAASRVDAAVLEPAPVTARTETPVPANKAVEGEQNGIASPFSAEQIQLLDAPASDALFQSGDYHFNRALFYQQAKDWDKALVSYSRAAELDPDNADTYNNKGVIYKELGQYDRAVEELLRAVFLKPDYGKAYNNIGVVYYLQNKYDEAIRNYRKAIEIDPANLEAFNNLAIAYKNRGEPLKAQRVLNRALSLDADHPATNYNLAVFYEEAGDRTSALHYYRRFLQVGTAGHPLLVLKVKQHVKSLAQR